MEEINAHAIVVGEVEKKLKTSIEKGLTREEVTKRLEKYGKNELIKDKGFLKLTLFFYAILRKTINKKRITTTFFLKI